MSEPTAADRGGRRMSDPERAKLIEELRNWSRNARESTARYASGTRDAEAVQAALSELDERGRRIEDLEAAMREAEEELESAKLYSYCPPYIPKAAKILHDALNGD